MNRCTGRLELQGPLSDEGCERYAQNHENRKDEIEGGLDVTSTLRDDGALPGHPDIAGVLGKWGRDGLLVALNT